MQARLASKIVKNRKPNPDASPFESLPLEIVNLLFQLAQLRGQRPSTS